MVSIQDALTQSEQANLDLVEISPQSNPPVAKITDWGKYQYEKTKQQRKAKKKQKSISIKQVRFGLKIGQHDLAVKEKSIRGFLEEGSKVKMSVFFRGREITHPELGKKLLKNMMETLADVAALDQEPELSGKYLTMVIKGRANAQTKNS